MADTHVVVQEPGLRDERRRFPRRGFRGVVVGEPVPGTRTTRPEPLLALDLSEGGLGATARDCFPRGSRLLLSLEPPESGEPVRLMGEVVRVAHVAFQDRWSLGVKFDGPSAEVRQRLRDLMAGALERFTEADADGPGQFDSTARRERRVGWATRRQVAQSPRLRGQDRDS